MFPDVELVLTVLLAQFVPSTDHTGTVTPADLEQLLPFVQVVRYGGPDDGITDQAAVDINVYAATRAAAINLARQIHAWLLAGPHAAGGALIDTVATAVGPVERPRDGSIRCFGGSYTVSARRTPA